MTVIRIIIGAGIVALCVAIAFAMQSDGRPLPVILSAMIAEPWTMVTLVDLYLGFMISAVIIIFAEERWWAKIIWAAPVFVLGNVWTGIWLVARLARIRRLLATPKSAPDGELARAPSA